jgi:hypothetical protein
MWYKQGTDTCSYLPLASSNTCQVFTVVMDSPRNLWYQQVIAVCHYLPLASSHTCQVLTAVMDSPRYLVMYCQLFIHVLQQL